jgi:hypothetical protein
MAASAAPSAARSLKWMRIIALPGCPPSPKGQGTIGSGFEARKTVAAKNCHDRYFAFTTATRRGKVA